MGLSGYVNPAGSRTTSRSALEAVLQGACGIFWQHDFVGAGSPPRNAIRAQGPCLWGSGSIRLNSNRAQACYFAGNELVKHELILM